MSPEAPLKSIGVLSQTSLCTNAEANAETRDGTPLMRRKMNSLPLDLPDKLRGEGLPRPLTSDNCEQINRKYFWPAAARTIRERWPLPWRLIDGKAVTDRDAYLAEAQRRFDEAPVIRGGMKADPEFDDAA
jgi:hypothetical protein